jgi:hypothetical protein
MTVLPDTSGRERPRWAWLVHAVAIVGTLAALLVAPAVDGTHPATTLSQFFATTAQVSATLVVAIALLQSPLGDPAAQRMHGWLSRWVFVYLGIATAAGTAGSITSLGSGAYPWFFALSSGPAVAGLVTVLGMGAANVAVQRERAAAERAKQLGV